jgi:hydrogenase expression/formation protein HypD
MARFRLSRPAQMDIANIFATGTRQWGVEAERRYAVPGVRVADPKACQCGEVLKGVIKPYECKVFGTACTPERPIGTCMVSSEGACAAYYNYGRFAREREVV